MIIWQLSIPQEPKDVHEFDMCTAQMRDGRCNGLIAAIITPENAIPVPNSFEYCAKLKDGTYFVVARDVKFSEVKQ